MKNLLWLLMVVGISACDALYPTPSSAQLPYESLTPLVADAQPLLDLQAEIDGLNGNVGDLEAEVARLELEMSQLQQQLDSYQAVETQAAYTPTVAPTAVWVATSVPYNVMTVTVVKKVNLRRIKNYNDAGKPIMVIQEPRIQYQVGETFQVLRPWIIADGGSKYYEVVGPRGAGLYARGTDLQVP